MSATVNGTETEDVIPEALAAGLLGIDASRRVGWAKAFERARHVEDLEEQVSALQSELKQLRLCYIRLVGFTAQLPIYRGSEEAHRSVFDTEVKLHREAIRPYFNRKAFNSGRDEADKYRGQIRGWDEERLAARQEKHAQRVAYEREDARELADAAVSAGHDARLEGQPDGRFFCSCSCSERAVFDGERDAWIWVITHRVTVVYGVDIKEYRKIRKAKRRGPRCVCSACGDTHGVNSDDTEIGAQGWLEYEAQRLASEQSEVTS